MAREVRLEFEVVSTELTFLAIDFARAQMRKSLIAGGGLGTQRSKSRSLETTGPPCRDSIDPEPDVNGKRTSSKGMCIALREQATSMFCPR